VRTWGQGEEAAQTGVGQGRDKRKTTVADGIGVRTPHLGFAREETHHQTATIKNSYIQAMLNPFKKKKAMLPSGPTG